MEVVPQICSSWLAGERAGCIKPGKNKPGGNGGEEMRRGESLVPLCGRKYLPIKENELKAVSVGGRGERNSFRLLEERKSSSVGLICPQWSGERRGRTAGTIISSWRGRFGYESERRREGRDGEARLMEITFHSIWRKGEREKKMSLK